MEIIEIGLLEDKKVLEGVDNERRLLPLHLNERQTHAPPGRDIGPCFYIILAYKNTYFSAITILLHYIETDGRHLNLKRMLCSKEMTLPVSMTFSRVRYKVL